ncbi:MAG: 16S rRNA (guanine(966)-N(2))-methyltransferase RsmD [Candidatus Omnitrophica bacterium]|nr:16S rRNA (guanine(966)-N(2))-methyltransferase RsmD [Candidatus Omnitrophota bacterium]
MRIITGFYKSRLLKTPKGIRPTEDRVRKALFDILGDVSGLTFLELFAGSGSVGLEALSQGAQEVFFVEHLRQAGLALEENIKSLGCQDRVKVICQDAFRAIENIRQKGRKFDLIFADPPYYQGLAEKILQTLGECDILHKSGYIIIQHFKKDFLAEKAGNLALWRQEQYGDSLLSFYSRK